MSSCLLLLVNDVLVYTVDVEELLVLGKALYSLHAEHLQEHLLGSVEEYVLVSVAEIERFRENSEKFWLLEAHAKPFIHDKLIQDAVELDFGNGWILL